MVKELQRHLTQPSTRARLVLDGATEGISAAEVSEVVERWVAMLEKRALETDPLSGPVTLRSVRSP